MCQSIIAVLPEVSDLRVVQESVRGQGIDVQHVQSSDDALKMLASGDATVVVYDADRGKPWREAVPQILATRPQARVVLLSDAADKRTWFDLFDFGAYDLVLRSIRTTDLRAVLRSALDPPKFFVRAA